MTLPHPHCEVYKTVGGAPVRLDVYPADGDVPSPVLVWIHGGALIMGNRSEIAFGGVRALAELCVEAGYTLVSIDYRLAPEARLAEIVGDLRDAWRWINAELPRNFAIDTGRLAVFGRSAGGYLTLMAGFCVEPRPVALVSLYGYGDITAGWYTEPSAFHRTEPLVSAEEAAIAVAERADDTERELFYLHCRQQGTWVQHVAGLDPARDVVALESFRPIHNVSRDYPPTLLLHGTDDTDVPYEESVKMYEALSAHGVHAELVTIPGGPHCFEESVERSDLDLRDLSPAAASLRRILQFLREQLG